MRPNALGVALGRVIAEQRRRIGLSQEALAFASGLHRTYIGLIERGRNVPTVAVLYDLAGPLQVPPSELVRRLEERIPPPATGATFARPSRPSRLLDIAPSESAPEASD